MSDEDENAPIEKLQRVIQELRSGRLRSVMLFATGPKGAFYDYAWLPHDGDLPHMMMVLTCNHHRMIAQCESLFEDGSLGPSIRLVEEEDDGDERSE